MDSFYILNFIKVINFTKRITEIAKILGASRNTTFNTRERYVEEGLINALLDKSRHCQPKKYTEKHVAEIITVECTSSPN
jgi:putative transposase